MSRYLLPAIICCYAIMGGAKASDLQKTETEAKPKADRVTHVRAPFVNVDIAHHKHGKHRVSVRAPFTRVEKPAKSNHADVQVGQSSAQQQ